MNPAFLHIALVGNPNCGKTALFNLLTGGRQKVANYAGVTVERKAGRLLTPSGFAVHVLDLPGAYSFESISPDERITRDILLGQHPGETPPDLVVCVADATNLRLHLRFVLEVKRMGRPVVLALNMMDEARRRGIVINVPLLQERLGIGIVQTVAVRRDGASGLLTLLDRVAAEAGLMPHPRAQRGSHHGSHHAHRHGFLHRFRRKFHRGFGRGLAGGFQGKYPGNARESAHGNLRAGSIEDTRAADLHTENAGDARTANLRTENVENARAANTHTENTGNAHAANLRAENVVSARTINPRTENIESTHAANTRTENVESARTANPDTENAGNPRTANPRTRTESTENAHTANPRTENVEGARTTNPRTENIGNTRAASPHITRTARPIHVQNPSPPPPDLHAEVRALLAATVTMPRATDARDDAIDRIALHPVLGMALLALVMFLVFQAVYSLGKPVTDMIGDGFDWLGAHAGPYLPDGPLRGLVTDGLLAGLGTVLGFLPEILVLFFFILVLEESGYLPRAAFLLDRLMLAVGLTGRSFIPLLSSFACAIPGVMGTRSITDWRDRLTTMLVAPLMTCSARLPVYALLIGAFIPARRILGVFNLQGLVLFALYAAGIGGAMLVGWLFKHLRKRLYHDHIEHALLMELPSYRLPKARDVVIGLWERCTIFTKRLTGVILALTVLMWFISTFPSPPAGATGPAIDYSFAGYLGRALQYVFAPLGFNWQISLSLIPAFAARETAVSALATVYAVGDDAGAASLGHALAANVPLSSALSLLVWFAFAPQCMSTLAVIRRETRSWKTVALSFGYMFAMAYAASFLTCQAVKWLM